MKSSLNRELSFTYSKLFTGSFATLPKHIDYLHLNIENMTSLYFYHNLSCICCYPLHIDK